MAGEIQVSKLVTDARDGNLEEVRNALLRTYPAPPVCMTERCRRQLIRHGIQDNSRSTTYRRVCVQIFDS